MKHCNLLEVTFTRRDHFCAPLFILITFWSILEFTGGFGKKNQEIQVGGTKMAVV